MTGRVLPLVIDSATVSLGGLLGQGGQGKVNELRSVGGSAAPGLVVKRYLPHVPINAGALTRLVAWRRSLPEPDRAGVDEVCCWPRSVLVNADRAEGAVLPRVPPRFAFLSELPSGATRTLLRELQFLLARPELLARRGLPTPDTALRLRVLARFTAAVARLHRHGVVLGDVSVKNVLWTSDPTPAVYLLDSDSFRLAGTEPVTPQPNSPGWFDPAFPATQNLASDAYKVALVVLRVLAHDFQTRDPERATSGLGRDLLPLLRASLTEAPTARPPVAAWPDQLDRRATEISATNSRGAWADA
ncbi:hypothetical protein GCM10023148_01860 [Actinokineospora soli]